MSLLMTTITEDFQLNQDKEIKEIYLSVPEEVDRELLIKYLKENSKGLITYAYTETTEDIFNYNKNKFHNVMEFDENMNPIGAKDE